MFISKKCRNLAKKPILNIRREASVPEVKEIVKPEVKVEEVKPKKKTAKIAETAVENNEEINL